MKYYIFYALLAFLPVTTISLAQTGDSSNLNNKPVSGQTQTATANPPAAKANQTAAAQPTGGNKTIQDIISFLPVAFFFFIVSTVFIKLRKDGVKLSEILIDKETVLEKRKADVAIAASHAQVATAAATAISANPNAAVAVPAETFTPPASATVSQTTDNPEQSTSRLIVFICGITSIALACCITSYYFYKSFTGGGDVSISNLSNVLYGLGLGVIPYGFNKIAAALK
ncbi:hypothetical protein [Fluviicola sp.]|uniref:hypothetical protein n=1 Tax=Fluviicola sp. TaxID=1917219 RepID=UPI0031D161C1